MEVRGPALCIAGLVILAALGGTSVAAAPAGATAPSGPQAPGDAGDGPTDGPAVPADGPPASPTPRTDPPTPDCLLGRLLAPVGDLPVEHAHRTCRLDGTVPGVASGENRTCVHAVRTLCLVFAGGDSLVAVEEAPPCPGAVKSFRVDVGDGKVFVCLGAQHGGSPDPPEPEVTPPSGGFGGTTGVGGCPGAIGGSVVVLGNGVMACVEVEVSTDGEFLDVDLTPCPSGVDPSVDVAGVHVRICILVTPFTDLPRPPDAELPDPDDLLPDVDLAPCPGGMDPGVVWLGFQVHVCVVLDPWLPSGPGLGMCEPGEVGVVLTIAGAEVGLCAS